MALAAIMIIGALIVIGIIESRKQREVSGNFVRENLKELEDHTRIE